MKDRFKGHTIRRVSMLLLWTGSMGAMYLLGRADRAAPQPASAPTPAPEVRGELVPSPGKVVFKESPVKVNVVESIPEAEQETAPAEVLEVGEWDFQLPLKPLSPDELEQILRGGLASHDNAWRDQVFIQLLHKHRGLNEFITLWAKVDGRSAMEYALNQEFISDMFFDPLVRSWAEADPGACLAYLTDQGMTDQYLVSYLRGSAKRDLAIFTEFMAGIEDPALRQKVIGVVAADYSKQPDALFDWAKRAMTMNNPNPDYVKALLREVYLNPPAGRALADWVARNPGSPWLRSNSQDSGNEPYGPKVFRAAAYQWAATDPFAALDWVDRNATDPRFSKAYDSIMYGWREADPPGYLTWIGQNYDDPRVSSTHIGLAASALAESDPKAAAGWVGANIGSDKMGRGASAAVVKQWVKKVPYEAWDWIGTLPEDHQDRAYWTAVYYWPSEQRGEVLDWLAENGAQRKFDDAKAALAGRYPMSQGQITLSVASSIIDPRRREEVLISSAQNLIAYGDAEMVKAWLPTSGLSAEARNKILLKEGTAWLR